MTEPTREQIERTRTVIAELEQLEPTVYAVLDRARAALSALEWHLVGNDTWSDEQYEAFDEATGLRRLYDLVFHLHRATADSAMWTEELDRAKDRELAARLACHGNMIRCAPNVCGQRLRVIR